MLLANSSMKSSAKVTYDKDEAFSQERPIDEALSRLDRSLDAIDIVLSELADRLNPVSRERCPKEDANKPGRPPCGYPVGSAIHRAADLIDAYIERIRDMTDRLGV
ncbi:hypothetical protein FHW84_002524 [Dyella sp. SG562]|uniref:hypothetical protein n=1 Tax=Dyella sp. SG562 TaxID=2587017 RepID=UPI001421C9E6|nr:hypothetical protein [Dyella sp. SG562]NII73951.1 hypothetical protein [Dyella sp. SG562]